MDYNKLLLPTWQEPSPEEAARRKELRRNMLFTMVLNLLLVGLNGLQLAGVTARLGMIAHRGYLVAVLIIGVAAIVNFAYYFMPRKSLSA